MQGGDTREKVKELETAMEDRGLKICCKKTKHLKLGAGEDKMRLSEEVLGKVDEFMYLGSVIPGDGELETEIHLTIQSGWKNWKSVSGLLCDRKVKDKIKGQACKTMVRPAAIL